MGKKREGEQEQENKAGMDEDREELLVNARDKVMFLADMISTGTSELSREGLLS